MEKGVKPRLSAVLLMLGLAVSSALRAQTVAGRPVVIFVHGRDQMFEPQGRLERFWFEAFDAGLERAHAAGLVPRADRRFVYYASYFAPGYEPSKNCEAVERTRGGSSTAEEAERALVEDIYERTVPVRSSWFDRIKRTVIQDLIAPLPGEAATSAVLSLLGDTKAYLERRERFCDTNNALIGLLDSAAASKRPVILVAHSMGALVVYNALAQMDSVRTAPPIVDRLVTFGTQLGYEKLMPAVAGDSTMTAPFRLPSGIKQWVNLYGRADYLAWPVRGKYRLQRTKFAELSPQTQPNDPHGVTGYLIHPWTARAVASAWCAAFRAPQRVPARCTEMRDVVDGWRDP
jgi:pimeloyl-ACP methyl ester carboxylesterase